MKFKFRKKKYGKELLMDCEKMSAVKTFTKDATPFLVDFHEILFVTQGEGVFRLDNERMNFSAGTVLLLPPNKWRQWETINGKLDGYFLIFEEDFISSFFNDQLFLYRFHFFYNNSTPSYLHLATDKLLDFFKNLENINQELQRLSADSEHLLRATLYLLLININRLYSNQFNINGQFFGSNLTLRFRKLLEKEIRIHNDVSFYADKLKTSKSNLNKTLKESLGKSTSTLIKERLLVEAKRELLFSKLSIAEIGYQLNFSEPSNFNRFFKNAVGIPPKEFRQLQ
ncbi:MAG: helix-turn-helix domain-containing protein [Saprospiraceae bacterium]